MEKELITTKNLTLTPINGTVEISLLEIDRLRQEAANWKKLAVELEGRQMEVKVMYVVNTQTSRYDRNKNQYIYDDVDDVKDIRYFNLDEVKTAIENIARKKEILRTEREFKNLDTLLAEKENIIDEKNKVIAKLEKYLIEETQEKKTLKEKILTLESNIEDYIIEIDSYSNSLIKEKNNNDTLTKEVVHLKKITSIKNLLINWFSPSKK